MSRTSKRSSYLFITTILLAVIVNSCATKKEAQTVTVKTTSNGSSSTATATVGPSKKEGIKKFSDLIPEKTKVQKGLFNTYKVEGKYYYEFR